MNKKISNNNVPLNINSILKMGLRYWYIFIISGIISVGIGGIYFKMSRPVLKFMANIIIKEEGGNKSAISTMMLKSFPFGNLGSVKVNDELLLLNTFTTYREAVKQLNLNTTYTIKKFPKNIYCYNNEPVEIKPIANIADTLKSILYFKVKISSNKCNIKVYKSGILKKLIGETTFTSPCGEISTLYGNFTISPTSYYNPEKNYNIKVEYKGYDLAAELLQKKVEVDLISKKANLINLSTTEYNFEKGKDILNSLIKAYNSRGLEQRHKEASDKLTFLDERLNIVQKELSNLEIDIELYKKQHKLADIGAELKAIYTNNGLLKKQQLEIETQYVVIEYMENFIMDPKNQYSLIPLNIGLNDPKAIEGLQQYNDALLERMKLLKSTNINNPAIEIGNEQLNAMRLNLLNTVKGIKNGLKVTRDKLMEQDEFYEMRLKDAPTQERDFTNIQRKMYLKQELYIYLLQQREESCLTLSSNTPNSQIVDAAYCLSKPVSPRLLVIFIMIIFLTCTMSIGYILIKEHNHRNESLND